MTHSFYNCMLVAAGGAAGAVCRYLMGFMPFKQYAQYPINTLIVNIIGTFLIGFISSCAHRHADADPRWILFLQIGFCGGFTTLSSVTLEFLELNNMGQYVTAVAYYAATIILCAFATWGGVASGR